VYRKVFSIESVNVKRGQSLIFSFELGLELGETLGVLLGEALGDELGVGLGAELGHHDCCSEEPLV
jgi:hypothetical protein